MSIIPHYYKSQMPDPWEAVEANTGLTALVGSALKLEAGKAALCAAADKPEFICMQDITDAEAGAAVHVIRVNEDTIYETQLGAETAGLTVGEKYQITADADAKLGSAAEDGAAEVVSFDGTEAGARVRVKF